MRYCSAVLLWSWCTPSVDGIVPTLWFMIVAAKITESSFICEVGNLRGLQVPWVCAAQKRLEYWDFWSSGEFMEFHMIFPLHERITYFIIYYILLYVVILYILLYFLRQGTLLHFALCLLSPRCIKSVPTTYCWAITLQWTSIPFRGEGSINTPRCFMLMKPRPWCIGLAIALPKTMWYYSRKYPYPSHEGFFRIMGVSGGVG